jgi:hypothetical protein
MIKKLIAKLYLWIDNEYCTKHLVEKYWEDSYQSHYDCPLCVKEKEKIN